MEFSFKIGIVLIIILIIHNGSNCDFFNKIYLYGSIKE